MMGQSERYEVERDRFGIMYSGPLEVGECVEVVPLEYVLTLINTLPRREESGERLTASDFAWFLERALRGRSEP